MSYTQQWLPESPVKNVLSVSLNNTAAVKALSISCPTCSIHTEMASENNS